MKTSGSSLSVCSLLLMLAGCSTTPPEAGQCAATSIDQVLADPLAYTGKKYCGPAVATRPAGSRVIRLLSSLDERLSYDQTTVLAASAGLHHLGGFNGDPASYYIEATIDPMTQCFAPPAPDNGETCSPFARPVVFHITRARKL
jgi:hypothetical protein